MAGETMKMAEQRCHGKSDASRTFGGTVVVGVVRGSGKEW